MSAPTEAEAKRVIEAIMGLSREDFDRRTEDDVGDPMIAFFAVIAEKLGRAPDDDTVAAMVHMGVVGFLAAQELART